MKAAIARAIIAGLLLGASWVCWTAGQLQARLAEANHQVVLLQYASPLSEYDDIEQSLGQFGRLPLAVMGSLGDVRARRATAQYWGSQYGALAITRDAAGSPTEQNPELLFLAANAAYRRGQGSDRLAMVSALDDVIANYAEVLKKNPDNIDAAYNYEYAVRVRAAAVQARQTPRTRPGASASRDAAAEKSETPSEMTGDLPPGPTIHGHPGAPPKNTDMKNFKMIVPLRPDERQGNPDKAGEGKRAIRRG